jgi:hypothetical protein
MGLNVVLDTLLRNPYFVALLVFPNYSKTPKESCINFLPYIPLNKKFPTPYQPSETRFSHPPFLNKKISLYSKIIQNSI